MNSLSISDFISLINHNITDILEKKIECSTKASTNLIINEDKDLYNDSIRFYEFISNTIEGIKYKFSLLKESRYNTMLEDIECLHYFMKLLNAHNEVNKDYKLYETKDMKLLFIFIVSALENKKVDFDSFKNMCAIIHNLLPIEVSKYNLLFQSQIQDESKFFEEKKELLITEEVKKRKKEISNLYLLLENNPNYIKAEGKSIIGTFIKIYEQLPDISFELRSIYSMLTKESFEKINQRSLTLNDSDFYYNNRELFPSFSLIYDDNDNMKKAIMYYGKHYLDFKNTIDYFTWIYKLRDDCFTINLTMIKEIDEILKTHTIRQLFKQILTSQLVSSFYQNDFFGKQCYEQYTKLCKQFESKEELNNFFDNYIHVVIMSPEYKTIIIRYKNIFINGSGYVLSSELQNEEEKQLKMTFILIALFCELPNLLLNKEYLNEEHSQYSQAFCEYAFGKKYLSIISLEQSAIVLEPNNWNLKEEDNLDVKLIWKIRKITKSFKENKNELHQKTIQFKYKPNSGRGWCLCLH